MTENPLAGRRGYWLRQFSDTSERTLEAILKTITGLGGATALCLKCRDGVDWVGSYDTATPIHNLIDVTAVQRTCQAAAVTFVPVVVPRGVAGEAAARYHLQGAQAVVAALGKLAS